MDQRCVIISGAPTCLPFRREAGDFIIACDAGYRHAVANDVVPDLIIGDFDSYSGALPQGVEVLRARPEKDDTDTLMAARKGLELGFRRFLILGATGGRLDHQMANLSTAAFIAQSGAQCIIRDQGNTLYTMTGGSMTFPRQEGVCLSVFSWGDLCTGVTLEGLKYPLHNYDMSNCFPIGVSNEFIADTATVRCKSGILFIIISKLGEA